MGEKTITPRWMTIAEASDSCRERIKCGCKTNCTRQCKCKEYQLRSTELVDALEIATIELVFNDFYSIAFFSKQWAKLDIFFKKSTNNII